MPFLSKNALGQVTETSYSFLSCRAWWDELPLIPSWLTSSLTSKIDDGGSESLFMLGVGVWRMIEQIQDGKMADSEIQDERWAHRYYTVLSLIPFAIFTATIVL
jgi:hypothetical protein